MNIHILGICGTFMGGLAALARADGHKVSGSDENVYPPMSTQLESLGIEITEGYDPAVLDPAPDLILVGNALSRGNPCVEHLLNQRLAYASGPGWLGANYLKGRRVLAVAGTHGKTSTASMLAWILEHAGRQPGFLIGGLPNNFGVSARSSDDLFVVEADEYDTAFFDKRAKFVHYRPDVAILNNLEFDHADIYADLAAIQQQFHHFVRMIAGNATIVTNGDDGALKGVLDKGCWSRLQRFSMTEGADWQVELAEPAGRQLIFRHLDETVAELEWTQTGRHNAMNALAAMIAASEVGVEPATAAAALAEFQGVKRRLEFLGEVNGARVYDDFAHHPTAIRLTLEGLRRSVGGARILVALEPASNTMRGGHHVNELAPALMAADHVWFKTSEAMDWDPGEILAKLEGQGRPRRQVANLLKDLREAVRPGDHVVFMSNKGFANAPQRFVRGDE
ncbi:MAG: UDP-N-acetylmuramate:L-alanyl-gamma-D-glutamyl-meso-diaminopimelate ligase [Wenzhouxiangella sp.]|nr:UDP-N-acetylmuramate:L-alanyl-gamma-D-glutamyl-meso-diaminopimelate ligase [Wenzhouxiangella sp.]